MNSISIKAKLAVGFGVLLAMLLALGAVSYSSVRQLSDLSAAANKRAGCRFLSRTITSIINDQKAEYRAFLLSGNEPEMARYADNTKALAETFSKLEPLLTTEEDKNSFAELRQVSTQYHGIMDQVVALHRAGKPKEAIDLIYSPQSEAARVELGKAANDFVQLQNTELSAGRDAQAATESSTTWWIVALPMAGLVIGIVVSTFVARAVSRGITKMVDMIQELAANNLAVEDMEIASRDEVGRAGAALNSMKNNLREIVQSIAATAEHVASASEELSSSATQQSQSAETQNNQTTQIATAMQEMSSTVSQVSENSNKAAEASRKAAETARHGGAIVEVTLGKMRIIAESVGGTARKMEELGKSSEQIGRIAGVIDDIADQTNLLALNAAIEAARAGEQGRGFAVVADEVRKLAERTTTATKEIAQMIKNIQEETKTAVTAMEAGTSQVGEGVKSTALAGDSLKEIIHMSEQVGEMITHIATAATEQSSASEEINNNMEQIAMLVKHSSDAGRESAKACQDLSGLALDLQQMVGKFNLGNRHSLARRSAPRSRSKIPDETKAFAASAH